MYFKQYINQIGESKTKDSNKILADTTKGAGIGGLVGILVGLARRKNIVLSAFIGSVVGAAISKAIKK